MNTEGTEKAEGTETTPVPVKLFVGLLTGIESLIPEVRAALEESFGPVDLQSPTLDFDFTDYYREEMGSSLKRVFYAFEHLMDPAELASVKVATGKLEARYRNGTWPMPRPVNLDPGYLEQGKLVLASTKNFYHRIYLGQGIYAEVTLYFKQGRFQSLEWTYPDYRSEPYQQFFLQVRARYREQLSASSAPRR